MGAPLNVVLINDSAFVNGGAAKIALTEARALASRGQQVHLLCGVGPIAADLEDIPNLRVHLLDIDDVNTDPNRVRAVSLGVWNPRVYRYTKDLLQSLGPERTVVHAHSWTRALSSSVLKAALDSRCAVAVTLHDYLMGCPQGTFFDQQDGCNCSLKPMSLKCVTKNCDASSYSHKLWRVCRKYVQGKVSGAPSNIRHYISVSNSSLELLRPYLPTGAHYYPLPNPIHIERLEPATVERADVFCFAGRFVPEKGALLFAEAAQAQGVATRFVGDGPQREQIVRINPAAQLTGWMGAQGVTHVLRESRALVFPSLWHEVLGLTVLEAAAHGVPSIVPRGCGAEESVIDGVTGFHFRSGDVHDLGSKIGRLKDPEVAARLGRASYEMFWAKAEWTLRKHVEDLESIYTRMLIEQDEYTAQIK